MFLSACVMRINIYIVKPKDLQVAVMENTFEFYLKNPIIKHSVGIVLVKDSQHRFIASNRNFSIYSGLSPERLIGLSDFDMPWNEQSEIYISHEKDILSGLSYSVIEPLPGIKNTNLVTHKKIIYDINGIPRGTIATALPLEMDINFCNLFGTSDIVKITGYGLNLTKKESLVFYYFIKGFQRSQISNLANISTSSFDFHISNIKEKVGVNTTKELREMAYTRGFQDIIPFAIKI